MSLHNAHAQIGHHERHELSQDRASTISHKLVLGETCSASLASSVGCGSVWKGVWIDGQALSLVGDTPAHKLYREGRPVPAARAPCAVEAGSIMGGGHRRSLPPSAGDHPGLAYKMAVTCTTHPPFSAAHRYCKCRLSLRPGGFAS
jgi:hypothetical protein